MRKIARRMALTLVAVATAAAPFLFSPARPVAAFSSCPTDPLSHLTPADTNFNDSSAANLGVKFSVNGAPYMTGVKFYKGVDNTGTHVAHVRQSGESTDLASATFTNETASGWQTVYFDDPVPLIPGWENEYVVWVSMPNGHYALDGGSAPGTNDFHDNGFGDRYSDVVYIKQGNSGLYTYTSDDTVVPTNALDSNYWVSPIVTDTVAPDAASSLTATDNAAGTGITWADGGSDVNTAYSGGYNTVRTEILRTEGSTTTLIGQQSGNSPYWVSPTSTQRDTTARPGTTYTYGVRFYDGCGNVSTTTTDTVTTASQTLNNIFSTDPTTVDSVTAPTVVGMHWQTSTAGSVWGARIYRAANTNPTTGNLRATLWDSSGTALATAYVPAGTQQSGWIDVRFTSPVSVAANTDYVIGYYSPNGQEVYTNNVHNSAVTNGSLTARADSAGTPNGVYAQGAFGVNGNTFPTNRAPNGTWYGVDVNFIP